MNVLELHDLTREFTRRGKPFAAVDHVNLILREGEFIAIVGRSGNGKSTLLNLITGLLRPTDGTITLDGRNIVALRDRQMSAIRNRVIGFVTQSQTLLPNLTVIDNVILPAVLEPGNQEIDGNDDAQENVPVSCWKCWKSPIWPTVIRRSSPAVRCVASPSHAR